ncbi:MAG: hypothetical protein HY917_05285 [Candidatus Diapherotrites archaeon]|nr:hypothetical protein [Candidatus Diapherotrites archaeon]
MFDFLKQKIQSLTKRLTPTTPQPTPPEASEAPPVTPTYSVSGETKTPEAVLHEL